MTKGSFAQLLRLSGGVLAVYLLSSYVQESMMGNGAPLQRFGWFVTGVQFCIYTGLSAVEIRFGRVKRSRVPLRLYMVIAFITVSSMGLANAALEHLNFPVQVIFKSCKLLPVMLGGVLLLNKKYSVLEYSASICLCLGLVVFTLADASVSPQYSSTGIIQLSAALAADGFMGNVQERALKHYGAHTPELMHYSYGIGSIYIFGLCLLNGQLFEAIEFCQERPFMDTYGSIMVFALTAYFGVKIVLALIRNFDALTAVTVTSLRKAITMIISFVAFPKPVLLGHIIGGLVVAAGVALHVVHKQQHSNSKDASSSKATLPVYRRWSQSGQPWQA